MEKTLAVTCEWIGIGSVSSVSMSFVGCVLKNGKSIAQQLADILSKHYCDMLVWLLDVGGLIDVGARCNRYDAIKRVEEVGKSVISEVRFTKMHICSCCLCLSICGLSAVTPVRLFVSLPASMPFLCMHSLIQFCTYCTGIRRIR